MKAQVQILAQGARRSFKEGKFVMHECQCVVLGDAVQVGVLKINDKVAEPITVSALVPAVDKDGKPAVDEAGKPLMVSAKVVPAGAYELEYGLGISWDTKELGGHLKSITRLNGSGNSMLADLGKKAAVKQ